MTQALERKMGEVSLDEEAVKALETLIETAVKLKESGMLDMLRFIADKSGELLMLLGNDVGIQRALGLAHAAHSALENRVSAQDVAGAKPLIETMTGCTIKAMAATDPAKAQPRGLFGMLGALRDKDVQMGLAVLLDLAKNLGACIRSETGRK